MELLDQAGGGLREVDAEECAYCPDEVLSTRRNCRRCCCSPDAVDDAIVAFVESGTTLHYPSAGFECSDGGQGLDPVNSTEVWARNCVRPNEW